jgi:tRNA (cmo5U34)-methyltransferase
MDTNLNQFNSIARGYDALASMIFGQTLRKAQCVHLNKLPQWATVLILGGGSGTILLDLFRIQPTCRVFYVEASSVMIALARKRIEGLEDFSVDFIHGTENDIPDKLLCDVVATGFFMDMFSAKRSEEIIHHVRKHLVKGGIWISTDFTNSSHRRHRVLLRLMYLFFRMVCKIEANKLPPWEEQLKKLIGNEVLSESFLSGFVKSAVYRYGTQGE